MSYARSLSAGEPRCRKEAFKTALQRSQKPECWRHPNATTHTQKAPLSVSIPPALALVILAMPPAWGARPAGPPANPKSPRAHLGANARPPARPPGTPAQPPTGPASLPARSSCRPQAHPRATRLGGHALKLSRGVHRADQDEGEASSEREVVA